MRYNDRLMPARDGLDRSHPSHRPTRVQLLVLVFIVLLGASLRLLWIQAPLLDAHRWRQVDTAGITRSLYEDRFNVFYPQVNWGGANGYVESEFPLLPAITAALYEVMGPQDYLGRVVVMVFSTATIAATFWLGAELLGPVAGLAAAFLLAVSPGTGFLHYSPRSDRLPCRCPL